MNPKQLFRYFTLTYLVVITSVFWLGSRVPQLNEKAMMAGSTDISGLAFDPIVSYAPDAPIWKKITYNTINWIDTNKKGMAFGILCAAAFLILLSTLNSISFKSRFLNALFGAIAGAPLGVCVNCAAPIGYGAKAGGARTESAVNLMISSPTLNFIVLSMLFSFFPFYIIGYKLLFTFFLLLIVVPSLAHFFGTDSDAQEMGNVTGDITKKMHLPFLNLDSIEQNATWSSLLYHWLKLNLHSLWFIVKKTVPLMLLAGLFGSIAITLLPFDALSEWMSSDMSRLMKYSLLFGVVLVGTFLPVPIAFDVIIALVLMSAGVPKMYIMAIVFCMGAYSIYAYLIIHKMVNYKMAVSLFIAVMVLGGISGFCAHKTDIWYSSYELRKLHDYFTRIPLTGPKIISEYKPKSKDKVNPKSRTPQKISASPVNLPTPEDITISKVLFQATESKPEISTQFKHYTAYDFGIDEPLVFSENYLDGHYTTGGAISSGDFNRDHRTDLLITSGSKLSLYANIDGGAFSKQPLPSGPWGSSHVVNAALVDFNNDGWLDIFASFYLSGNYILYSNEGHFNPDDIELIPNVDGAVMSMAAAFADADGDTRLDIHVGNWSVSHYSMAKDPLRKYIFGSPHSRNALLYNKDNWQVVSPEPYPGETLSTLFTDFNDDHTIDLIETNDFSMPDYFFKGPLLDSAMDKRKIDLDIPYTTLTTMSVTSADIDNDLTTELYFTQVGASRADFVAASIKDTQIPLNDPHIGKYAQDILTYTNNFRNDMEGFLGYSFRKKTSTGEKHGVRQEVLIAYSLLNQELSTQELTKSHRFSSTDWTNFHQIERSLSMSKMYDAKKLRAKHVYQKAQNNILLKKNSSGSYKDLAPELGIDKTGWSWTGKFADLDLDGYQDLLVTNGFFLSLARAGVTIEANYLFKNNQGESFTNVTTESGLLNYWPTNAYTYIDIDNDGDLDIITMPTYLLPEIYINQTEENEAISVELNDKKGNYFGIGSKVIIHYGGEQKLHQMREIQAGGGFKSFDAPIAYFGLNKSTSIDSLEVIWAGGTKTLISTPLQAGAKYIIKRD